MGDTCLIVLGIIGATYIVASCYFMIEWLNHSAIYYDVANYMWRPISLDSIG